MFDSAPSYMSYLTFHRYADPHRPTWPTPSQLQSADISLCAHRALSLMVKPRVPAWTHLLVALLVWVPIILISLVTVWYEGLYPGRPAKYWCAQAGACNQRVAITSMSFAGWSLAQLIRAGCPSAVQALSGVQAVWGSGAVPVQQDRHSHRCTHAGEVDTDPQQQVGSQLSMPALHPSCMVVTVRLALLHLMLAPAPLQGQQCAERGVRALPALRPPERPPRPLQRGRAELPAADSVRQSAAEGREEGVSSVQHTAAYCILADCPALGLG